MVVVVVVVARTVFASVSVIVSAVAVFVSFVIMDLLVLCAFIGVLGVVHRRKEGWIWNTFLFRNGRMHTGLIQ